jgi:hypothetical protein
MRGRDRNRRCENSDEQRYGGLKPALLLAAPKCTDFSHGLVSEWTRRHSLTFAATLPPKRSSSPDLRSRPAGPGRTRLQINYQRVEVVRWYFRITLLPPHRRRRKLPFRHARAGNPRAQLRGLQPGSDAVQRPPRIPVSAEGMTGTTVLPSKHLASPRHSRRINGWRRRLRSRRGCSRPRGCGRGFVQVRPRSRAIMPDRKQRRERDHHHARQHTHHSRHHFSHGLRVWLGT